MTQRGGGGEQTLRVGARVFKGPSFFRTRQGSELTFGISVGGEGHVLDGHLDLGDLALLQLNLLLPVQDLVA